MKQWLMNPEVKKAWGGPEEGLLRAYRNVWERKEILRSLYEGWYRLIEEQLSPGFVLEIGGGTGNLREWMGQRRRIISLDLLAGKNLNLRADAHQLPFKNESVPNIVLIDVLHHLERPYEFIDSVARVLKPNGRLILLEPYVSVWGYFIYKFVHHENVDFGWENKKPHGKKAWEGNAAIPQIVFQSHLPLKQISLRYLDFLAYPLSGGFSYRSLLPSSWLSFWHNIEKKYCLFKNRFVSLRILATYVK